MARTCVLFSNILASRFTDSLRFLFLLCNFQFATYSSPVFWVSITIFKDLGMNRLEFVLAHCVAGLLDITLSLRDVRKIYTLPATPENIDLLVDTIFRRIGPFSSRWRSFTLITENPYVFRASIIIAPFSRPNL